MMLLDKAIKHCEEVVDEKLCELQDCLEVYDMESAADCDECAEYHKQLVVWLKELKLLREQGSLLKKNKETVVDNVNHPSHYNDGNIEVIDFIEDKKLGFCLGNAVKYISRAGKKDKSKEVEDLEKASWYIQRRIKEIREREG